MSANGWKEGGTGTKRSPCIKSSVYSLYILYNFSFRLPFEFHFRLLFANQRSHTFPPAYAYNLRDVVMWCELWVWINQRDMCAAVCNMHLCPVAMLRWHFNKSIRKCSVRALIIIEDRFPKTIDIRCLNGAVHTHYLPHDKHVSSIVQTPCHFIYYEYHDRFAQHRKSHFIIFVDHDVIMYGNDLQLKHASYKHKQISALSIHFSYIVTTCR